jgi:hypothetical protein
MIGLNAHPEKYTGNIDINKCGLGGASDEDEFEGIGPGASFYVDQHE